MNALILVDIQNDFLPGGALAVKDGDQVIPIANKVMPQFDLVIATQDWHPAEHGSFAVNHPGKKIGDTIDLNGLRQILWPAHCVQGTSGADLASELDRSRISKVFQKGTDSAIDSYSGFFDNGHRKSTGLGDHLMSRQVSMVFIMGLATDYCVKFTALDSLQRLGFSTYLIRDGCRSVSVKPTDVADALKEMEATGVHMCKSDFLPMER